MKKSTTARIEDTLDIVADKIVDLENTAKRLEQLKRDITSEISRFENISLKVDTSILDNKHREFISEVTVINNKYLQEVDKKDKVHRPLYYLILFLLIALLGMFGTIIFMQNKNEKLQQRIEWNMGKSS